MAAVDEKLVHIPRLWPIVGLLGMPVAIGLMVFLKRYRGTDRTAMALSLLVAVGLWLVVGLGWFQQRFGGTVMSRRRLRWIGLRCGTVAGVCAGGSGVVLLAIRWSSHAFGDIKQFCDQHGKPLVRLPGGYSPNQVAAQIVMQAGEKLGKASES